LSNLTALTADVVAAYVAENKLSPEELARFIASVHSALATVEQPEAPAAEETASKPTAAQIRKSITPNALISFVDGRSYRTLKRHLTTNGLTIAEYKAKYGLPIDYPTTAPSYSAARSAMAYSKGLGRKGGDPDEAPAAAEPVASAAPVADDQPPPAKRGRKKLHLPFKE
jgi:predicted transcriptional regulator